MEAFKIYGNLRWIVSSIKHNGWRKSYNFECWWSQVRTHLFIYCMLLSEIIWNIEWQLNFMFDHSFLWLHITRRKLIPVHELWRVFAPFVFNFDSCIFYGFLIRSPFYDFQFSTDRSKCLCQISHIPNAWINRIQW